jgi:hypothetical protein
MFVTWGLMPARWNDYWWNDYKMKKAELQQAAAVKTEPQVVVLAGP